MKKISYAVLVMLASLAACSTVKKALPVAEQSKKEEAPQSVYQASYPMITDIINTKLDISFNWDSAFVYGKASIQARPYFYPSSQLILNAQGFKINEVSLILRDEKQDLKYTYDGKLLTIQLDKEYTRDQQYTVFIDYVAMPNKLKAGVDIRSNDDRGIYFINADGKQKDTPKQVWSQGETECNSIWFPTINGPQEKMTQDISITVPDNMVTLSNGLLDYSVKNSNGTHTDTWRQEKPHSTYLTMIAAGEFVVTRDKWQDKEVSYYMEPKFAPYARTVFGKTPEMIGFFSNKLGVDFPWDKYSQIVVREFVAGAMENTSATVLFDRMNMTDAQYLDNTYEDIVSHELFHQWFGDLVTAESWSNLPLNESFATYGEYLWNEYKYGRDVADYYGEVDQQVYLKNENAKKNNVIRFDYTDREKMFDDVSYQKGGRILHMLRKTVGDEAFFKALNLYLTRNEYKTAEIHDLRLAFEEVSGQDLNWFFNEWFMASGHPVLNIQQNYDAVSMNTVVTIRQMQDLATTPLYQIPMGIDIYIDGKVRHEKVVLDKKEQSFRFAVSSEPQLVNVDADKYILGEKTEKKSVQQNVFQYENAPLFMDRYEAILALQGVKNDKMARAEMMKTLNDKSWVIRRLGLLYLPQLTKEEQESVYVQVRKMALNDPRSFVRAEAISQLSKSYGQLNNKDIFNQAAKDKAPSVVKALEGN